MSITARPVSWPLVLFAFLSVPITAQADATHLTCEANAGSSTMKYDLAIDLEAHTVTFKELSSVVVDDWTNEELAWHGIDQGYIIGVHGDHEPGTYHMSYNLDRNTGTLRETTDSVDTSVGTFNPKGVNTYTCRTARRVL